jgi:hypothetical protein
VVVLPLWFLISNLDFWFMRIDSELELPVCGFDGGGGTATVASIQ